MLFRSVQLTGVPRLWETVQLLQDISSLTARACKVQGRIGLGVGRPKGKNGSS
jgi:hypothetical protein